MDEVKILEEVLERYRYYRDIINECDLGIKKGWTAYRDAQENLYLDLGHLLGGILNKKSQCE